MSLHLRLPALRRDDADTTHETSENGVGFTERTPIRMGRTRTGGLFEALVCVGLLLAIMAWFV
jgi:hypothetical protein